MGHGPEVERLTAASNSAMVRSSPPEPPGVLGRPMGRLRGGGAVGVRSRCTTRTQSHSLLHTKGLGPVMSACDGGRWVRGWPASGGRPGSQSTKKHPRPENPRQTTQTPRFQNTQATGTYVSGEFWSLRVLLLLFLSKPGRSQV